ncbi:MAG: APC family permease [Thermoguttaceae bacterium]
MQEQPKRQLTLFDSTCLIVGIILGVGVYRFAPDIAKGVDGWWQVLAIWAVGGLLSLFGAFGYAELATAYPGEGGDYVYLTRAYGRWAGFLFGWLQLVVVRPGDIAIMAFAFATYAAEIYAPSAKIGPLSIQVVYACAATILLTVVNIIGVQQGKWTQNALTVVKALGLLAIVGVACFAPAGGTKAVAEFEPISLSVAMILVLFCFGGWNEMVYVAAEVKDPRRNIVRALVVGTVAVTVIYLLVNSAFLHVLGYEGLAASKAVASDTVAVVSPALGGRLISALICISALGAVNGLVFAGARISYAVGQDHFVFRPLGKWNAGTGTPVRALTLQGILAVGLIVGLGSIIDTVVYTAPAVYTFYIATSISVLVLRFREPNVERPYRVTGFPITTILFCCACALLIFKNSQYAYFVLEKPWIVWFPFGVMLAGLPIYWLSPRITRPDVPDADPPLGGQG